jgi:hypothetical protein
MYDFKNISSKHAISRRSWKKFFATLKTKERQVDQGSREPNRRDSKGDPG